MQKYLLIATVLLATIKCASINGRQYQVRDHQPACDQPSCPTPHTRRILQFKNKQIEAYRLGVFQKNKKSIQEFNKNDTNYKRGETAFMYQDPKQFLSGMLMQLPEQEPKPIKKMEKAQTMGANLKTMSVKEYKFKPVDWRSYMTQTRHQTAKCGSCYAFSVTYILQAYYKLLKKQTKHFSEQQIIECCKKGCNGCIGGWPGKALEYIAENGIANSKQYPYTGKVQKCSLDKNKKVIMLVNKQNPYNQVSGIQQLETQLISGPISVIIDASTWDPLYKTGVFNLCPKQKIKYNHAVICTGVKQDKTWIVRNSWGKSWGDDGYIYLAAGNSCGIADKGIIPNMRFGEAGNNQTPDDNQQFQDQAQQNDEDSDQNQDIDNDQESEGDEEQQQDGDEYEQDSEQQQQQAQQQDQEQGDGQEQDAGDDQDPFSLVDWLNRKKS